MESAQLGRKMTYVEIALIFSIHIINIIIKIYMIYMMSMITLK